MANLADFIEDYLKIRLTETRDGVLELQRSELAERFNCVPSQINYVLATRFTPERGYLVESRRGGGGYIRIIRLNIEGQADLHRWIAERIGRQITQEEAHGYVQRLLETQLITDREAALLRSATAREVIGLELPVRDIVRANLFRAMLLAILRFC